MNKKQFVVCVTCRSLGEFKFEFGKIADAYVPVEAENEVEACKSAVLWHGDNGEVVEDVDFLWMCDDVARRVTYKATKCIQVSAEEMFTFLSLTQGVSTAVVIGRSPSNNS